MSKKTRRHFKPEEKAEILRRHVADKVPASDLCDQYGLQPSVFHGWLRQLLANAPVALERGKKRQPEDSRAAELQAKVDKLEARLASKDSVIAELSEELVKTKKANGEP